MKIVVTGALGHIGSGLIRELPAAFPGAQVDLIDNLSTQRFCSLFDLPKSGTYRFYDDDILSADLTRRFAGADVVVHLAAITNAAASFDIQKQVEEVNYEGTRKVAEACIASDARLLFPSTTSVYGTQSATVDEECAVTDLKPQSPYAESKLRAEQFLQSVGRDRGLRHTILRFGTIFGVSPGMRFHTAINKFCWQAVNGIPLSVWKTAIDQRRPYLDLQDAINSTIFVIRNQLFHGELYNVVTENLSVREVIDAIRAHIPGVKIEYVETRIMNQLSYNVLADKFGRAGFRPAGSLAKGIAATLTMLDGIRAP
jgi:UDP-glucose 4-epimerase